MKPRRPLRCAVWACPNPAVSRCDAGFRYGRSHRDAGHTHMHGDKAVRATFRRIPAREMKA